MVLLKDKKILLEQRVRIIIDPPGGIPTTGVVRVIQDEPGKKIGVELDHFTDFAHSLDQRVDEKTDPVRGITVGKGWWTLPENLEIL